MKICTVIELEGLGATYAVHLRLSGKLVGDFLLVIIELFLLGAFVLSQYTRLTDGQLVIGNVLNSQYQALKLVPRGHKAQL